MTAWMTLWTIVLVGGALGMVGLLLLVTAGAIRELKESLADLSADVAESPDSETSST
ncbi:MAG: hypothetical protein O2983_16990 [Planctomycetota bacterium]|nr:hypothetical protein [Planctomycetota bacterium]MDA0920085.1 hypothetical protein [Planctomycetota bacterium]MDA1161301.1 hypothetical protein [Planctomycetota bacterium]